MTVWQCIFRELHHRKLNACLAAAGVAAATGALTGALVLLKVDGRAAEAALAEKGQAVAQAGAELEDAMRKITKGLGFNVIILPEDQDLQEMHLTGSISKTMPEAYVDRLANSNIVTVNHLLPTVTQRLTWPEKDVPIVLYGTRGEVPIAHRDPKKPLLDAVPEGSMIVGFQLARKLGLEPGQEVELLGRPFTVLKTHDERGTVDDTTVWINLREAQAMLGLENLIHAIQALECHCAGDRITQIRQEITSILPGTQAIERGPPALARAEARDQARITAEQSLVREAENRSETRERRQRFASILVPLTTLSGALLMGLMVWSNVRQRRQEIAILGALGIRSRQILTIFLGKALVIALAGGLIGLIAGAALGTGMALGESATVSGAAGGALSALDAFTIVLALGLAVSVGFVGSWLPALAAARQDAATVLQEE